MKCVLYVRSNSIFNDSRATKEIETFCKAGYRVIVVGWDRNGDAEERCKNVFQSFQNQLVFCMYKAQVGGNVGFKNIGKLYNWLRFVKHTVKQYSHEVEVVHGCNLDSILTCLKTCKKNNIKIVYDIYDYYIDNHLSIPNILRGIIERMEINLINESDICIICTEERREQISKAHPKKVIVVHNTPDVEMISSNIEYDYFYCGILYKMRLINEIFNGYTQNKDLKIGFAGFGPYSEKAVELNDKYEKFSYHGQVTYKECLNYEAKAICLSAIYEPTIRNHRLCAPNKFYESLALGKPVIVCKGTGIDRLVEEHNIGIVINYDENEFYNAVRFLKNNPKICMEMGKRARNLYETQYNWKMMEQVLLNAYDSLLNK